MFTNSYRSFNRVIVATLLVAIFSGAAFFSPSPVHAKTTNAAELQEFIKSLLAQIATLQTQLQQKQGLEGGYTNDDITVGSTVLVTNTLNVRSAPGVTNKLLKVQTANAKGTVIQGPLEGNGYTWVKVQFEDGVVGWVVKNWLKKGVGSTVTETEDTETMGNDIAVGLVYWESKPHHDYGEYEIELEITADDSDVYLAAKGYLNYEMQNSLGRRAYGESETATVLSSADLEGSYYVVPEGETETFKIKVVFFYPKESDEYTMVLAGVDYKTSPTGTTKTFPVFAFHDSTPVTGDTPTCKVSTDKETYGLNGTMKLSWSSTNAEYLKFIASSDSKFSFAARGQQVYKFGSANVGAVHVGTHTIVMRAVSSSGKTADCSVTIKIADASTAVSGSISSITASENPYIKGTATGASAVGISISNGDKVYSSGDIAVVNGEWSHKVTTDLPAGKYTAHLYANNVKIAKKSFTVESIGLVLGTYKGYLNGSNFITTKDISKEEALANCKLNAKNNPNAQIYCTWNNNIIFDNRTTVTSSTEAKVYAVGVYEASNATHSFCESGWGDVTVTLSSDLVDTQVVLVLSSYEPVKWIVKNPSGVKITKVILAGYNAQDVSGAIGDADVEHHTFYNKSKYTSRTSGQGAFYDATADWPSKIYHWASQCSSSNAVPVENRRYLTGSDDYAYAYTSSDSSELSAKVKEWTGQEMVSFQGAYRGTSFTVSSGKVLGVNTTSPEQQLADILFTLTKTLQQIK